MNALALVHSHAGPSALIEREDLVAALNIVIGAVDRQATIPVLSNVMLMRSEEFERCIVVSATNLDVEISVNVRANVSEDFATTVPAHALRDILRKIPDAERNRLALELLPAPAERRAVLGDDGEPERGDDGEVVMEDVRRNEFVSDRMSIRLGCAQFELKSLPASEFPALQSFTEEPTEFTVSGSALWNAVDATRSAMSKEETRHYLNGAYLHVAHYGALALAATDGHRLIRQDIVDESPVDMPGMIVPSQTINLLHALWKGKACPREVALYVSDTRFAATWGPVTLISKLIDGTFPDYARIMPTSNDRKATFRAPRMLETIAALTAVAKAGRGVRCGFTKDRLVLTMVDAAIGSGSMTIDVDYAGEPIDIAFNPGYLTNLIGHAAPDGGNVTIHMADSGAPALLTGSLPGWTGVLMPMRA